MNFIKMNKLIYYTLAAGISLLSVFTLKAQNTIIDEVVAVVGPNIILQSELETQYLSYRMQGMIEGSSQNIKCRILKDMIFQKLLLNQAEIDSVEVQPSQVNQELERRFRYFIEQFGSKEKMEAYYGKSVDEFKEEMREAVENQLIQQNVQSQIVENVSVTPREVKAFYKQIEADSLPLINTEYQIAELVKTPEIEVSEKLKVKERLLNFRNRILKGESFATLAILYSEDPGSAKKGGELGMYGRGELYPEFENVAFNLKEGEVSGIVETEAGYHIIQMIENKGDYVNVRHILLQPKVSPMQIEKTVQYLDSVYTLIQNQTYTFEKAVNKFSDAPNKVGGGYLINAMNGSTIFTAESLDPKVFYTIKDMKEGDFSKPVSCTDNKKEAYRLLCLMHKTESHKANIDKDYDKIYTMALNYKRQQALDQWMIDNTNKAYIKIGKSYNDCPFAQKINARNRD